MGTAVAEEKGLVECRLESAHDLAALLAALQLREKDQKDQRVHCEASSRGLKFVAQSAGKDIAVIGWIFSDAFTDYRFTGAPEEVHLKLPVAPLLSCLQIFSDRAVLVLRYPSGPHRELQFTLEEEGAVTECHLKTLVLDDGPSNMVFFAATENISTVRPKQPEAWYQALSEFTELDAPDVMLRITLRNMDAPGSAGVVFRVQTHTSDAEVELPRSVFDELQLTPEANPLGEVTYSYQLSGVLASCLRASKDAKALKVRFNSEGVMSHQFILRSRGQQDLFCESLVSPLAEFISSARVPATAGGVGPGGPMISSSATGYNPYGPGDSVGF